MIFLDLQLVLTLSGRFHVQVDPKTFLCGADPVVPDLFLGDLLGNLVVSMSPMIGADWKDVILGDILTLTLKDARKIL